MEAAAGATAVQEVALHSFTHTRTAGQSAAAIGGSALFGGAIGAGAAGAARISRGEWDALLRARQREAAEAGGYPLRPMTGEARYAEREVAPHVDSDDGAHVLRGAIPVSDAAPVVTRAPDGEVAPAVKANETLGDTPPIIARDIGKVVDDAAPTAEPAKVASGPEPARYSQREVRRYVALTDGSDEFGYITSDIAQAVGVEAAPIRLPAGQHNHATDKGYGEVHIQARHGAELFEAGFDDVAQFTLDVVKGFDAIYEGHGGALLLVKQGKRNQIAVVDLRTFGTKGDVNWEVATAAIYKPKYFKNKKLLWSRPDTANFPPAGEPPFGPRSQSDLNIANAGGKFNPSRAPLTPVDSLKGADSTGSVQVARQPSADALAVEAQQWTDLSENLLRGENVGEGEWAVSFSGDSVRHHLDKEGATLGRAGHMQYYMPLEDSFPIVDVASAYKHTGAAASIETAYLEGGQVQGVIFPLKGREIRLPTRADAGGSPHFLEGGHTAVALPNGAGFLVNDTREFVTPGGDKMPLYSVLFDIGIDGKRVKRRKWP